MRNLKEANVENKIVLVRCDFNVGVNNNQVIDDFRIEESLPTINDLKKRGAKVVLISHLGRPKEKRSFKEDGSFPYAETKDYKERRKDSLWPIYLNLREKFKEVDFVGDCVGKVAEEKIKKMKVGEIVLLENLRHYKDEKECGKEFSQALANLGDIYVNNAFSVSHRKHSSIYEIAKILPPYPGLVFEKEIEVLSKVKDNVDRPFVAIVGGAKVESKIKTVTYFAKNADYLLLGGKVANTILGVKGFLTGQDLPNKNIIETLKKMDFDSSKINFPVDSVTSSGRNISIKKGESEKIKKGEDIFDIGPDTINNYKEILKKAKTIVWAGPLGFFEKEKFKNGTESIADRISKNKKALTIVGGGDTAYAFKKFGYRKDIDHICLGGGAMLSFLSDEDMPGIQALN